MSSFYPLRAGKLLLFGCIWSVSSSQVQSKNLYAKIANGLRVIGLFFQEWMPSCENQLKPTLKRQTLTVRGIRKSHIHAKSQREVIIIGGFWLAVGGRSTGKRSVCGKPRLIATCTYTYGYVSMSATRLYGVYCSKMTHHFYEWNATAHQMMQFGGIIGGPAIVCAPTAGSKYLYPYPQRKLGHLST